MPAGGVSRDVPRRAELPADVRHRHGMRWVDVPPEGPREEVAVLREKRGAVLRDACEHVERVEGERQVNGAE